MSEYFESLMSDQEYFKKRNKFSAEISAENFERISSEISSFRLLELHLSEAKFEKMDFADFKSIHRYIFQDIYWWAGRDRGELGLFPAMGKGQTVFTAGRDIDRDAERIFRDLKEKNFLKNLRRDEFVHEFAKIFAQINKLHPFREGNGRATRIFLTKLAKDAGCALNLDIIPKDEWNAASAKAVNAKCPDLKPFEALIADNLLGKHSAKRANLRQWFRRKFCLKSAKSQSEAQLRENIKPLGKKQI